MHYTGAIHLLSALHDRGGIEPLCRQPGSEPLMGRIEQTFLKLKQQRETALIPFVTAGDPDAAKTAAILETLDRAGADLIELGMPFSDPMADGPTIQAASERALAGGMTLAKVLDLVAAFRRSSQTPIVLMGYYNPVFRFGLEAFARRAAQAGVDALLLVDVPPEERAELYEYFDAQELDLITLLAPTTPAERAAELLRQARGFVYYVSMTGVTGTTQVDTTAIADQVRQLRIQSPVPVAVGFGIATAEDAEKIAAMADAVVVGSALVKIIAQHAESAALLDEVYAFVHDLKQGVRRAQPDK